MVISVINLDKCLKKFKDYENINIMPVIVKGTRKVQRTAKELAPVDTGTLRNSIKTKTIPRLKTGIVYTALEYAPHQEFGTVNMPAQPFMNPAMALHNKGIQQDLKTHMRTQLRSKS
jgi:HK97 gp10 family phage protein